MAYLEKIKKNLKDLEVPIEKLPLGDSPFLIEEFIIIGYTDVIKEEKVIKIIKENFLTKNYNENNLDKLEEFTIGYLPSALSSISADTKSIIPEEEILIKFAFPIPPTIYYTIQENIKEPEITKIIFNNIREDTSNTGYAYSFYEKEIITINEKENIIIYFPKAFMIISQYNYFYSFHKICEYLHNQYLSDKNEIPLEILIYNIVNFIPCPLNNKMELSLFPDNDLSSIKKFKDFNEYKKNGNNNFLYLEQLGGYKHSDINFCKIFQIFSPEMIIQIYLQILLGRNICFFSGDKEKLHLVAYIFNVFLFPLNRQQKCFSLNPNKYYCDAEDDSNLICFLSSYKNIKNYKPKDGTDFILIEDKIKASISGIEMGDNQAYKDTFAFAIDIDEQEMEIKEIEEIKEYKAYKALYDNFNLLNNNLESNLFLNPLIIQLIAELRAISILIKENQNNSLFVEDEKTKKHSEMILEAFFKFNIIICNEYLNKFATYKDGTTITLKRIELEKKEEEDEEKAGNENLDYYFFFLFKEFTGEVLSNMIVTYGKNEPKIEKVSKRGFENLIAISKEKENNYLIIKGHYIELMDCIFRKKNDKEYLTLSFFEFFNYFYDNLRLFIFRNINDDYIDKKIIKKDNSDIYYYKYKKIIFDNELLLKYANHLKKLPENIRQKLFPMSEKINKPIEKIIHTKDYYDAYEKFFISYDLFQIENILEFCILNIVVLSTSELKLIHFIKPIYSILKEMSLGIRKYIELILNVSYRVLINKNITDINIVNKYFDVYKILIEYKKMFPNDELIVLNRAIKEYTDIITDKDKNTKKVIDLDLNKSADSDKDKNIKKVIDLDHNKSADSDKDITNLTDSGNKNIIDLDTNKFTDSINLIPSEIVNKIQNTEANNLFKLIPENEEQLEKNLKKEGEINETISLKSELLNEKEISNDCIYCPYTLYFKLNDLMDKYYESVDIQSIDKKELKKLIINLIYYLRSIKTSFPDDTIKFLFYCLIDENSE